MGIINLNVEQNLTILDRELWDSTKKMADLNKQEIEVLAEERFLKYIGSNDINLNFTVDKHASVHGIKFRVAETNYDERGFKDPINIELAQAVSDQIVDNIEQHYKGPLAEAKQFFKDNALELQSDIHKQFMCGVIVGVSSILLVAAFGLCICSALYNAF